MLKKLSTSLMTAMLLLASTQTTKAINGKWDINRHRFYIALALLTPAMYFSMKDEPNPDHESIDDAFRTLKTTKPGSKAFFKQLKTMFTENFLGYWGKTRGIKPYGSKLIMEGAEKSLSSYVKPNGTHIELFKYDHIAPYGLLGTTYSYISNWTKAMKTFKEGWEMAEFWGVLQKDN